jgi:hypothetical protein
MTKRHLFYETYENEELPNKIEWYDLLYGLLSKDVQLFNGINKELIKQEFKRIGFSIDKVKF